MTTTTTKSDEGLALLHQRAARGDHEAAAVLLIVSHHRLIGKAQPFIDRDGVDFAAMMSAHDQEDADYNACPTWGNRGEPDFPARCWCGPFLSTGEHLMLMLAWNLWSGSRQNAIDISELLGTCDDGMLALAFDAMAARRGRPLPLPLQEHQAALNLPGNMHPGRQSDCEVPGCAEAATS